MIKNCKSCDHGSTNELNDIVCTNNESANCCEFMRDDDVCQHWQNYNFEFYGESRKWCFNCVNWCIVDGICGLTNKETDYNETCEKWQLCDDNL